MGRVAETVLHVPGQSVCVFAWGTGDPRSQEEGSLRALCAARTKVGLTQGCYPGTGVGLQESACVSWMG